MDKKKIMLIVEIVLFVGALCGITAIYYFGGEKTPTEEEVEEVGIIKITNDNYKEEIEESDKPVILEFSSNSCPPCLTMIPTMINIAKNHKEVKVANVNTSEENTKEIAEKYKIEAFPTIIVLKNGEIVDTIIGASSEENLLKALK